MEVRPILRSACYALRDASYKHVRLKRHALCLKDSILVDSKLDIEIYIFWPLSFALDNGFGCS